MECLRIRGLSKNFGSVQALWDVDLSLEVGEHRVVIGPNGAGKTTLFNLISGDLTPTHGRIYFFSKDITRVPSYQRASLGFGRTFQITQLFSNLSVYENVLLAVQALDSAKYSMYRATSSYKHLLAKGRRLLEQLGLWERKETIVGQLSHGEQRQLEVILALAGEPKLLLLDEPTSGLSAAETSAMCALVLGMSRDISVIIVEHNMDVAFKLADRLTVLHQGRVISEGFPEDIRNDRGVAEIYLGGE